ncbi:MAG: glycosyltransferase [Roseiflexaceae bacterium]
MHIVYLYKDYWPVMGGIESHLRTLAEGVAAAGHRVSVVVCQPAAGAIAPTELHNGVAIYRVPRHLDISSSAFSFALASIVRQLQPDVVHLQMPWPGGDLALLGSDTPLVVTYQSDIVRQHVLRYVYAPLLQHTLSRARAIVVTSPQYRDSSPWLLRFVEKCVVIPLAIHAPPYPDSDRIAYWQARFPNSCALWVGRMRYYKGLHTLMDAMRDTPAEMPLVLVGDGPLAGELQHNARQYGIASRVHFVGSLSDEEVHALHRVARFFVFPSQVRAEAFGLSLLEAMTAGLPAITCEIGTATSFVNQHMQTGIVVAPADASALAHAMTLLWSDTALCHRYAEHASRWTAAHFRVTQMVADTITLYQRILT